VVCGLFVFVIMSIIEVKDLSVAFPSGDNLFLAVQDVSFSVAKKEVFGIVGESGSGKSTLALAMLDLLPDTARVEGEVLFQGRDIRKLNNSDLRVLRGKDISMVFQTPASSFNPVLSIEYQFREVLAQNTELRGRKQFSAKMADMLEKVRLPEPERILKSYPHQLSGGQLQRVALAFALAADPKVLIADEPTSSLDVTVESQIINLLFSLKDELNISIVFITHNLDLVNVLCDRVCVLYKGKVCEIADKNNFFSGPRQAYSRELLHSLKELG